MKIVEQAVFAQFAVSIEQMPHLDENAVQSSANGVPDAKAAII